jgi:hypothetical protein
MTAVCFGKVMYATCRDVISICMLYVDVECLIIDFGCVTQHALLAYRIAKASSELRLLAKEGCGGKACRSGVRVRD